MRISLRDAALFRRFNHRRQLKLLLSMIGSHAVDASYNVIGTGAMRLILRIIMREVPDVPRALDDDLPRVQRLGYPPILGGHYPVRAIY
jgi:hypothetical protein